MIGCGGLKYNEAKSLQPKGSAFTQELYKNYIALSKGDYDAGNYRNSDRWAEAAAERRGGAAPKPTQVSDWRLPSNVVPEMTTARQRLQSVLDRARQRRARRDRKGAGRLGLLGRAAEHRLLFLPADIAACRQYFSDYIAKAEAALAPSPAPAAAAKPEPGRDYLVFFDLNKATLTPEGKKIVADAVAHATSVGAKAVKVVGYTDLSGTPRYNLNLSVRRAEAVEAELAKLGSRRRTSPWKARAKRIRWYQRPMACASRKTAVPSSRFQRSAPAGSRRTRSSCRSPLFDNDSSESAGALPSGSVPLSSGACIPHGLKRGSIISPSSSATTTGGIMGRMKVRGRSRTTIFFSL